MTAAESLPDPGPLKWGQMLFFGLLVRPLVWLVLGLNLRHGERLPRQGPAIVAANHNSHLDTLVLMALCPLGRLHRLRPVAAADYFLRNPVLAWFALRIIGILPLHRGGGGDVRDPLAGAELALRRGDMLLIFPEGTRGEPERPASLKPGIAHLVCRVPDAAVVPVHMEGLGKALPRGEGLLVPFICDVWVGEPLRWRGDRASLMEDLERWLCRKKRDADD